MMGVLLGPSSSHEQPGSQRRINEGFCSGAFVDRLPQSNGGVNESGDGANRCPRLITARSGWDEEGSSQAASVVGYCNAGYAAAGVV
jgi:hypothetical protein